MDIETPIIQNDPQEQSQENTESQIQKGSVINQQRCLIPSMNNILRLSELIDSDATSIGFNEKPESTNNINCKKNSLKFCRRINKSLVESLGNKRLEDSSAITEFLSFFQRVLEHLIGLLAGTITDARNLQRSHLELLQKVWEINRNTLSEKKNNKLSLVNFDEWESLFTYKGFCRRLQDITYDPLLGKATFGDESSKKAFVGYYSKLLYILNGMILNTVLFTQFFSSNKSFCDGIPDIENFIMMTMEPWLYKHYNHTRAKFALECCRTCKICRSTLLPGDFSEKLAKARSRYQVVKVIFRNYIKKEELKWDDITAESVFALLAADIWMR